MANLINVTPQAGYKLHLEYDDDVTGEADLSDLIGEGVFAAWKDAGVFEAVTVGKHGELHWTDDLELCADALYLQITGRSAGDLFPNLRAPADA
jgi:hypothetical protein